ncbi:MAG TPA: extracellular solute-binding protein [Firmicutes bacterium]|nr:extracellular solute-binding protein [Bacillota bacterium]
MQRYAKGMFFITLIFGLCLGATAKQIEIRLAGWSVGSESGKLLAQLVDEYNSMQDRVRIALEVYGGEQPLLVSYVGGAAPDIAITSGASPMVYGGQDGMFLALDTYIDAEDGFDRSLFIDDMWSFTVVDGKAYGIAVDTNERALFINKKHAENAGLPLQNTVKNWDDLLAWAKKMTIRHGEDTQQWGFFTQYARGGDFWHTIYLNDGEIFSADGKTFIGDHPNTIEAVQFLADMVLEHKVAPPTGGDSRNDFIAGKGSMLIWHSGLMQFIATNPMLEYVTVSGPPGNNKHGGRFSGASTSTFCILDSTQYPQEAFDFVKWISLNHGNTIAQTRNLVPLLREGLRARQFQTQPWDAFAHSILTYNPRTYVHARIASSEWWSGTDNFAGAVAAIITGQKPAASTLQEVAVRINAKLRQANATQ